MTQTLSSPFAALGEQFARERNDLEKDRKKLQDERDKFEAEKLATSKKLAQEGKDLEKIRAKLQDEREIFEAEKSTIMKTLNPDPVGEQTDLKKNCRKRLRDGCEAIETETIDLVADDVLEINAGGETFAVERSTLMMAPEASILRSLLGGRQEERFSRDGWGIVFLDVTPCVFRVLLSYLRELRMDPEARKRTRLMTQPEFQGELEAVCKYFDVFEPLHEIKSEQDKMKACGDGLEINDANVVSYKANNRGYLPAISIKKIKVFEPLPPLPEIKSEQIKMKACCDGLEINDGGVVSRKASGNGYLTAISIEKFKTGSYWKGRILSLQSKHWVFWGIIATDSPTKKSCTDPTSFGWLRKSYFKNGNWNNNDKEWIGWVAGDEAIFKLEQTHLKMYHKRLYRVLTLGPIPDSKEGLWRIHLNLYSPGDKVEISVPSDDEMRLIN
uniref:BTB domain-containing protein n=1 Tax=Corethron hystrix TaxID=216773 RepID=A0A7S1FU13_9STRA|mmetsp:Transcript_31051/g.71074  ORF Transcript_31051/g.71074 Transcript_31051/m.71074 type:complete len:443 (+) Transcript_31051:332-1660(+)